MSVIDDASWSVGSTSSWIWKMWVNHHTDAVADFKFIGLTALALFVVRLVTTGAYAPWLRNQPFLCDWLFAWAGTKKEVDPKTWSKMRSKLNENFWYSSWHTSSFLYGCWVVSKQDWTWALMRNLDGGYLFTNWAAFGWPEEIGLWYCIQISFWLSTLAFLFLENQRSDFKELFCHHVVTLYLLLGSYAMNQHRAGLMVAWIHDCADIFLYVAKFCQALHKLMEKAGKAGIIFRVMRASTDAIFAIFAVAFFLTRLILFPYICVLPGLMCVACINHNWSPWYVCGVPTTELVQAHALVFTGPSAIHGDASRQPQPIGKAPIGSNFHIPSEKEGDLSGYYPHDAVLEDMYLGHMTMAMALLLSLHAFWGSIIFKMVLKSIQDNTVTKDGDARSDDEGSSSDDESDDEPTAKETAGSVRKRK